MAAELFSTSLPHSNEEEEVEAKKSFIVLSDPESTSQKFCERDADQTNGSEERNRWQAAPPTLRER